MSEDDRAAKAARAKAMLKKRQQKKAGGPAPNTGIISPGLASPPSSRPFSPALSEAQPPTEEDKSDFGDVFVKADQDKDGSWLASLPRVDSPVLPEAARSPSRPTQLSSPPRDASTGPISSLPYDAVDTLRAKLEAQQQTVSSLLSEKASLVASLEHLHLLESKTQEQEASLKEERAKTEQLNGELEGHRSTISILTSETETLKASLKQLKDLESKIRYQESLLDEGRTESQAFRGELQNQQQTISLLVAEKSSLSASLERLEGLETDVQEKDAALREEQSRSRMLQSQVQQLEENTRESAGRLQQLDSRERDLTERCREQERELQLTKGSLAELREEADQHQRRIRDLEEQIQSDDRVERLESSLKNTQDRADELEFQLSKLKQVHTTLKTERDDTRSQLHLRTEAEAEWKKKHTDQHELHIAVLEELASATSIRDTLSQDKAFLQAQVETSQKGLQDLQQELANAVSALTTSNQRFQNAQTELKSAQRRADEAEKTQKVLQTEGSTLMRSLDEMRPKIVELTDVKLELGEKIESLEKALRNRDTIISQLESSAEEIREQKAEADRKLQEVLDAHEAEHSSAHESFVELQGAYSELQAELDDARASIQTLEVQRANHHQLTLQQSEEIERSVSSSREQGLELSTLHQELERRGHLEEEGRGFIERAQNEIEYLRAELSSKDEELQELRESLSSGAPGGNAPRSLDDEMLSALRQQHALDLSAATSQIRGLETSVFEAEAKAHSLQKQVRSLEDELVQSRSSSAQRPFSPGIPSRPSSRALNHPDLRRASFSSHRASNLAPPPARSAFDQGLNAETRHKRKVSLSMLKARIDSEVAAATAGGHPGSRPISPALGAQTKGEPKVLSTVREPASRSLSPHGHLFRRPQFLDESHIFWCHSCHGDLVIL